MKALVKKTTGEVLVSCPEASPVFSDIPGSYGEKLRLGELDLVDVPNGELVEDCDYVPNQPTLSLNVTKKSDRLNKVNAYENILQRMKALKKADLDTNDKIQDAIVDLAKAVRRLAKGD
jgi:hypothetical protein